MASEVTNETLAKRWLASRHWGGWRVGMLTRLQSLCLVGGDVPVDSDGHRLTPANIPDLDHPGTRAFLLEDVRKAWNNDVTIAHDSDDVGRAQVRTGYWEEHIFDGDTEQETLVLALESAE